ncbi:MAG: HK97 family phage prohead protease [Pseudomonadota bacterium]
MEDDADPRAGAFYESGQRGQLLNTTVAAAGSSAACLRAQSFDPDTNEVDAVFYSGAIVERVSRDGPYRMRVDTAGIDLSRVTPAGGVQSAVPLAIEHMPFADWGNVIGRVISARVDEAGRLVGRVALSSAEDAAAIRERVADGTFSSLSIGISILEKTETTDESGAPLIVISRARLNEVSITGIPADAGAGFLSAQFGGSPRTAGAQRGVPAMEDDEVVGAPGAGTQPAAPAAAALAANPSPQGTAAAAAGAAAGALATPAAGGAAAAVILSAEEVTEMRGELATLRETNRRAELREIGNAFDLPEATVQTWITENFSADQARSGAQAMFAERRRQSTPPTIPHASARATFSNREGRRAAFVDGVLLTERRIEAANAAEGARDYAGLTLTELARRSLEDAGQDTRGMGNADVAREVLSAHTTSDFPLATGALLDRMVRAGYERRAPVYQRISQRQDLPNFRPHTFVSIGDMPLPTVLGEAGEIQAGTFGEEGELGRIEHRARALRVSYQMLINDSLGQFLRIPELLGAALSRLEDRLTIQVLTGNGNMRDGLPLFDAAHRNVASSGAAISVASLAAAREGMRKQIGIGDASAGDEPDTDLDLRPRYLLVGAGRQTQAEQILRPIQSAKVADVNVFENGGSDNIEVVVSNRITGSPEPWFLLSDPADGHGLMHGFLEGAGGAMIETRPSWATTGAEFRVIHDFGAWMADFRGAWMNPGA